MPDNFRAGNHHTGMSQHLPTAALKAGRLEIDWGAAFEQHSRWLRTVIRHRLGEPAAVEDVLQEVGVAAARATTRPTDPEAVAPWLYRVAVRQCLFYRRTRGRRRKFENRLTQEWEGLHESPPEPLDWLLEDERLTALRGALSRLAELDREVLLLKYTEDWTYRELAEHLGVSPHVIEHRLIKAKQRLRKLLNAAGVQSE